MRSFAIARGFALMLLVLMANANDKLQVKEEAGSKTEYIEQFIERMLNSESEKSSKPELGLLQKPMLSKKNGAESDNEESSIKHMKLLPESENVLEHESADAKVTSANDNAHNETVPRTLVPLLQNDSTLVHGDTTIDWPTTHSTVPITNHRLPITYEQSKKLMLSQANNENLSLTSPPAHPESTNDHWKLAETLQESSTASSNEIEKFTIGPIDFDVVTDIVTSMLFGTTESEVTEALTESYSQDLVTGVLVIEDLDKDGIDNVTDQPESESSTSAFSETTMESPLLQEAITALENLELEATTLLANTTFLPTDKFDFFVFDEKSNIPCILMSMDVTLSIPYETKDQKYITIGRYQLPNELVISGHCGHENSSMTISWAEHSALTNQNNITFNFVKDHSSFYLDSVHINIALDSHHFPNAKDALITGNSSTNLKLFSASVQNGIHICSTETKVTCGNIVATISNVTIVAFNKAPRLSNRTEEYCNITSEYGREVSVSNIIAGIVGAVIALALVIALFSWCRRRSDISLRSELP